MHILFFKFRIFNFIRCTAFCRGVFLLTLVCKIVLAQSLVDFGYGVPTSAVLLDSSLFHVEVDKIFLLLAYLAEVMKEGPAVDIKRVLDILQEGSFASFGDVVIRSWIARKRLCISFCLY